VPEPLKNQFGAEIPHKIAAMVAAAYPAFDSASFLRVALDGYEQLELMPRGWHIAHALRRHLPADYPAAVEILLASLGPKQAGTESFGMAPFFYLPHTCLVSAYGLDHFEESMRAQYELTQRFTAEFSIRPFLERHPARTLARLSEWARDPSPHVRRLVSEGTRPRLPWAARLRDFQRDPRPVLALLELLKDDPELYVRRSVANNLNDIGKDHPALLVEVARSWLPGATAERRWLIQHALRSAVKRGDGAALALLGFGGAASVSVRQASISPARPAIGGAIVIACELLSTAAEPQELLVDLRIHFIKASGAASPKVFKLKAIALAPQASAQLAKKISLAEMTTRKHYPGLHTVELLINGQAVPLGSFELVAL
jgi:3-methyladenine DNA glycosylase AlkC